MGFRIGQKLVLHRLGVVGLGREELPIDFSNTPLLDLLPWQYFQLLDAFRHILGPALPDLSFLDMNTELRSLARRSLHTNSKWTLHQWMVLIAAFHTIFAAWPNNFFAFLDAISQMKGGKSMRTGVQQDFGVFYDKWLYHRLSDPAFSFLHIGFEEYLARYYVGGNVSRRLRPFQNLQLEMLHERPYLTLRQTSAVLGVGWRTVNALVTQKLVTVVESSISTDGKRYHCLVERESVEKLRREWSELLTLDTVARARLGIGLQKVLTLADAGLLTPVRGPKIDGYWVWLYKAAVVDEFVTRVLNCAEKDLRVGEENISLSQAMRYLGSAIPFEAMLIEILDGRLKPVDTATDQPLFLRLKLSRQEIARFLEDRRKQRREELGLLTTLEAAASLSIPVQCALLLLKNGLLEQEPIRVDGKQVRPLIRREAVEVFRAKYTIAKSAAAILSTAPRAIPSLIDDGLLHPVLDQEKYGSRYILLLREEVNALANSQSSRV